jgi:hypothetical protein
MDFSVTRVPSRQKANLEPSSVGFIAQPSMAGRFFVDFGQRVCSGKTDTDKTFHRFSDDYVGAMNWGRCIEKTDTGVGPPGNAGA